MKYIHCLLISALLCGCAAQPKEITTVNLDEIYEAVEELRNQAQASDEHEEKMISCVVNDMKVTALCRYLASEYGVSIVTQEGLDDQVVNITVENQPVEDVVAVFARRVGAQLTRVGEVYYIGNLRPEDKGVLVDRVTNRDVVTIENAIKTVLSEYGRCTVFPDGTVVVGDTVEVIRRVNEIIRTINKQHIATWYVQLIVITKQMKDERGYGISINDEINLTKLIADAASRNISVSLLAERYINAAIKMSANSEFITISQTPAVIVNGATVARIECSDNIPVPKKAVNNEGEIIATTEYQDVSAGMIAEIMVSSVVTGGHSLDVMIESSDVIGMNDEAPIVRRHKLDTTANMGNEQLYLIGVYYKNRTENGFTGGFSNYTSKTKEALAVEVWANVQQIR
ncbi:hypothetical protein JD969_02275 [Planctomycetota bacterium]|nr:hypothetical protein JD969_02275 [Planctomycetota bacterium]